MLTIETAGKQTQTHTHVAHVRGERAEGEKKSENDRKKFNDESKSYFHWKRKRDINLSHLPHIFI